MWAAAIVSFIITLLCDHLTSVSQAAGDATKHEPPNTSDFDGSRDGRLSDSRPRGRTGPRPSSISAPAPVGGPSNDMTALLMAALIPFITNQLAPNTIAPTVAAMPHIALTPPTTPRKAVSLTAPLSPAPDTGLELHACLGDFLTSKGIDLTGTEAALMELELTPDIVSEVPVARLCEVMGAIEGRVRKFQVFCREWSARLEDKKKRLN